MVKRRKIGVLGDLITGALDNIFKWLGGIFNIDFGAIVADMLGGLAKNLGIG